MKWMIPVAVGLALTTLFAGSALAAGPEWCDEGSPPPNDWRVRKTGGPSSGSQLAWSRSTTGGTLDLASGTNTLVGGVATGMWTASSRAPTQAWVEARGGDHDGKGGDDDAEDGD